MNRTDIVVKIATETGCNIEEAQYRANDIERFFKIEESTKQLNNKIEEAAAQIVKQFSAESDICAIKTQCGKQFLKYNKDLLALIGAEDLYPEIENFKVKDLWNLKVNVKLAEKLIKRLLPKWFPSTWKDGAFAEMEAEVKRGCKYFAALAE